KEKKKKKAKEYFKKSCNTENMYGCLGLCLSHIEIGDIESAQKNYMKACENDEKGLLTCDRVSEIKSNKKISKEDLKAKCHYDPDKPWWYWAGIVSLGVLGLSAAN